MPSIADTFVTILPETSKIAAGIKAAFREIGDQKVKVTADADTAKAKEQLDETAKERKAPVKADADTAKAKEELDKTARDRTTKIKVDIDKSQLSYLDNLISAGSLKQASAFSSMLRARQETQSLANQNTGGFDYSQSFLKMKSAEKAFADSMQGDVQSALQSGVQSGGTAGFAALTPALLGVGITMAAGIASALSGLAGLIPAGLLGAGGVVGTLALGLDGVKNAWDAAGKAALSSGKDQTAQAKAVQSAQIGLKTATQDEARAQRDVATARKDATKELRDLNSELRHGALDEKQAELNLQQDIFDLQHGTFQNSIDFQKQQLRVLTDQQDLSDAKTRNNDLSQKANTLRQQGVEGNPKVVDAEQRLADSIQKVAVAQQTLTAAFKPSADALAQAQAFSQLSTNAQALVNTLLGMKPAFQGLKFAVQDALFKDLGPQIQQLASSFLPMLQQALVSMASTMNQTFGQLASWLQKPETMSTIQTILNNITAAFKQFQPVIMSVAQAFLQLTSVGAGFLPQLGQLIGQIAQGFQQFINSGDLGAWIKDGITAFQQFIPIGFQVLQFFRALAPIGLAVLPALQQVFAALMPAVGPLASAFASLVTAVAPLLGFVSQLVSTVITAVAPALKTWFDALGPVIQQIAGAFGPVLQQLQPILGQVASTLANSMVQGIKTILPLLIPFVQQMVRWYQVMLPLLPSLVNLAISAIPVMQQAIAAILPLMTTWMKEFTKLAELILPGLTKQVEFLAKMFSTQFDHIKTIVGGVWDFVKPIFEAMKAVIGDIVSGLEKLGLIDTPKGATASGAGKYIPKTGAAPNGIIPIGPPFTGLPSIPGLSPVLPSTGGTGQSGTAGLIPGLQWGARPTPGAPSGSLLPGQLPAAAPSGNVYNGPHTEDTHGLLTPNAANLKSQIAQLFGVTDIGGYRNPDGYNEHSSGEALDIMVGTNKALGDQINQFLLKNAAALGVQYDLWQQTQWNPDGTSSGMADRGGATANHRDHVHVRVKPGASSGAPVQAAYPQMPQTIQPIPNAPTGVPGDPLNIVLDPTVPANQRSDKNGKGGGPSGQQLGQDFVSGIAQVFGIDGSVFPDPMSGGLFKGFKGLMQALTGGNKNGGGSYVDRYGSGAAPGGGSGSFSSILQGIIPQAVGDLNPAPGTGGAPGEFMPFQPGSQPGGLLAAPMGNQQPAPGAPVIDNSINFHGPVGDVPAANQAALDANIPRARQGIRPLPVP